MSSWLNKLIGSSKKETDSVLGINLSPEHASWCLVKKVGNEFLAQASHSVQQAFSSPLAAFQGLIESATLPKAPCHICLDHSYYNMLLVDAPDVPDDELAEAVKWKIKDLITQDVENVVVDAFRLPQDAYRGRMNMLYVAVTEMGLVQQLVDECDKADLSLQSIGVNELSMAALCRRVVVENDVSAAFLYMNGNSGTINLIEQGYLYLTRSIDLGSAAGTFSGNLDFQQDPVDNVALDVQRSLDYYESQLGKSGVNTLYLVVADEQHKAWCDGLTERLPVKAQLFELDGHEGNAISGEMGIVAPALGAALGGFYESA